MGAAWLASIQAGGLWLAVWVSGWAAAALWVASAARRRWAAREDLVRLAEQVIRQLDGQSLSLEQEQRQIERLQAAISDDALRRQIEDQLGGSAQSNLMALIGQLIQAEESVPEAAAVTKSWISRARHLASHTRVQLEQVREDVGGR